MSPWAELKRRNVLKVGAAYLVVAWLLIQVAATVAPQLSLPDWVPRLVTLLLMLGFPIALLVAWFLERTPDGVQVDAASRGSAGMGAVALLTMLGPEGFADHDNLIVGWRFHGAGRFACAALCLKACPSAPRS